MDPVSSHYPPDDSRTDEPVVPPQGTGPDLRRRVIPFPDEPTIDEASARGPLFGLKPVEFHEVTRARFALGLLVIFGISTTFALIASVTQFWPQVKDALLIVQPPITLLLGSALAFYFLTIFGGRRDGD